MYSTFEAAFTSKGFWQTNATLGLINGATNLGGQFYYNGGKFDENINYAQPLFAAAIKNPFYSNLGESLFSASFDKGGLKFGISDTNSFLSTFASNMIGNKIGDAFEVNLNYKPSQHILNTAIGTGVETFENYIGDTIKDGIKRVDKLMKEPIKLEFGLVKKPEKKLIGL
jgi:hypothetical protein